MGEPSTAYPHPPNYPLMAKNKINDTEMADNGKSAGKITCRLVIVLLSVGLGTNFQLYSTAVVNNIGDVCQKWINESFNAHYGYYPAEKCMNVIWSSTSGAVDFGAIFGALTSAFLGDKFGRKKPLIFSSFLLIIGAILGGLSKTANAFEMYIFSRTVIGAALGVAVGTASTYISESSPGQYKGACGSVQQIFLGLGYTAALALGMTKVLGTEKLWPVAVSAPLIPAALVQILVLMFFAPESPQCLVITSGASGQAVQSSQFFQGDGNAKNHVREMSEENKKAGHENESSVQKLASLFKDPALRKPMAIGAVVVASVKLCGISPIMAYSDNMIMKAGLDESTAQLATVGLGICTFVSPFLTMFLTERVGRKGLLISGLSICLLSLTVITVCMYGHDHLKWTTASIGVIPCLYIFLFGFALANSIAFIAPTEMFPQTMKFVATSVLFFVFWLTAAICVIGYLPFSAEVGIAYSYIPFIVCMIIGIILISIYLPETKDKNFKEISAMLAKK